MNTEDRVLSALSQKEMDEVIAQALEMEKRHMTMAYTHNRCLNDKTYECTKKAFENAEQYYTETYGPLPDDRGETNQNP